jgi:hypothetical protein
MRNATKLITIIMLFILFSGVSTHAQTFSEWFRQKATQRKYLIEQIAALKAYSIVLKKGYDVSRKGLTTIGDIKNGDFNLHNAYFNSLKAVNPEISKYPHGKDIITIQQDISSLSANSKTTATNSGLFNSDELSYIRSVYDRLSKDCLQTLDGLEAVSTPGKLEMKDDERIGRIDKLYAQSLDQLAFAKSFSANVQMMIVQKNKEETDLESLRRMYGIQ